MASSPFELEDQLDEDFFDKLVNDDDDFNFIASTNNLVVEATDSKEVVKAFSNLTVAESSHHVVNSGGTDVDFGLEAEKSGENDGNSALLDANEGVLFADESSSLVPSNVDESSELGMREESALDTATSKSDVASDTGVKEVQWSSFNSDTKVHNNLGYRSYLEIFNDMGDNSEDPFAEVGNKDDPVMEFYSSASLSGNSVSDLASSFQHYSMGSAQNQNVAMQDLSKIGQDGDMASSIQYWESIYPGWRFDPNTGQWYPVEGYDVNTTMNSQESFGGTHLDSNNLISNIKMDAHSLQQTTQSVGGNLTEDFENSNISYWNQISQGNAGYPAHMVFDPHYPGWYYDTIAQEWKMLECYTPAVDQAAAIYYNQQYQNTTIEGYESQVLGNQDSFMNQGESSSNYLQKNLNSFQAYSGSKIGTDVSSETIYGPADHAHNHPAQQNGSEPSTSVAPYRQPVQTFLPGNEVSRFQSFILSQSCSQVNNQTTVPDQQMQFRPFLIDSDISGNQPQQPPQTGPSFSSSPTEERSSAGRPPHALVTFGFGGKLLVMKNNSLSHTTVSYGNQGSVGSVISVLNVMEVVIDNSNASSFGFSAHDYFQTLCRQSLPGPLVGGNIGNKELYKWIDERIANCESSSMGYRGELLRLHFALLKISCQYYGKLRSSFGADPNLKESDYPELAVAKLLGSLKGTGVQANEYGAAMHCLQNLPSEAQMHATAFEVQRLLVSGRKKEALEFAREGQLWGPALVIASQLGDQFYGDTVKLMAHKQLIGGSPLRTLCLLAAGQPADVFSTPSSNFPGYTGANMLDGWAENLAIIAANRTKDDELVMIHLGDCLWKERGEAAAAHICYLVAETNFEPYSDGARVCLIGADHWNCPRTYASPEAIQRTELYEYSKVLGNSQFLLLPLQPYKLIYAYMLAEVGRVADSMKYCQAIIKSLKTVRTPEGEALKQLVSSLEERLRILQQGGATKLVGKLLTFFDNTAQRVVGGQPPPPPSTLHSSAHQDEFAYQAGISVASNSQPPMFVQPLVSSVSIKSTMTMPSLMMPSASMEPISERTGHTDLSDMPSRSISEPDFGQSDKKVNSSNEAKSSVTQEKAAVSSGPSRFGRFGSQLFQKTVGLVLRSRPDRQAKLGERNKFYYNEKLKRWVEEGAEPPAEEAALPPPPPTAAFQNGMNDFSVKEVPQIESLNKSSENKSPNTAERISGIPPIPPSSNQFSAHARLGVRSRYVDTFNKSGGSPVNLFQSPIPPAKPVAGSSPKFFIPSPVTPTDERVENTGESIQETIMTNESPVTSFSQDLSPLPSSSTPAFASVAPTPPPPPPPSSSSMTMQRFPSMDTIVHKRVAEVSDSNSRRTASWSGSLNNASNLTTTKEIKPLGEALGERYTASGSGEDLHEIQL